MIKGHRQRYYNDDSINSPSLELPAKYQKDNRGELGCLEKCLQDMCQAAKEIEQLEILNEFLEDFIKGSHESSCKTKVYRFVFYLRAETYDIDAHYFIKEILEALAKHDESLVKEAVSQMIQETIIDYPDKYDSVESKNALAGKIYGFLIDFDITKKVLDDKWKEILIILTTFVVQNKDMLSEADQTNQTLVMKLICSTMSALNLFLYKLGDRITMMSCREELESLLPNIHWYLSLDKFDRELRENCGMSVIPVIKALGQLMEHFERLEKGEFSEDLVLYYLEGTFLNYSKKILEGRENKCRILRIGASITDKIYDDFWGDSAKSYFVVGVITEMSEIIKNDLSDIHDWKEDEVQDLLITMRICVKLAKRDVCHFYFTRPFENILTFCMKQEEKEFERFEEEIFTNLSSEDLTAKLRGKLIIVLCWVYSSAEVLQRLPKVIKLLTEDFKTSQECDLSCHGEFCTHQNYSLLALVELSKTTIDPKDQYKLFLKHLLFECLKFPHGGWFRKQVKALLKQLITSTSDLTLYIIEDTQNIPTEMILFALNCMKKYPENFPKDPVLRELLMKALVAFDEDTRVAAAKVFQEISGDLRNVDLFLDLVRYGAIFQQKSLESKINWMDLLKPVLSKKKRSEEEKMIIQKFITDFQQILFDHFYAEGSFPRQRYALKILKDTWNIYGNSWEMKHLDAVFSCFDSPFEFVKKLVTECLKRFPQEILEKWIEKRFGSPAEIREKLKELMISVRPADSLQAAYQLVIFSRIAPILFPDVSFDSETDNILSLLEWCLEILQDGIANAKESILKASASNPLYGTILCIRYLLDDLPRKKCKKVSQYLIKESPRWRAFYEKILILCSEASQIVAPIVNNSSPEGFLPEDNGMLESLDDRVTPQMVLLCGWRTIKEVSLLLGEICEKTPETGNLISSEEIVKIGENLTEILLESKHRGAFEVSAVGFSKLCTRLYLSSCSTVNQLPKEWLEELLNAVLCPEKREPSTKYIKLCVTRRSAGLPFLIQAIITAYDPSLLSYAIKRLLKESQKNTEGRIHSMNILRYIYRCSTLSTFKYSGDGLKMVIESFASTSWAERNSATLLFSALIVRIFGVCRSKGATEELSQDNCWIFNEFFNDYPQLYDFMLQELKEANEKLERMESVPQLYPIFLLLERLPVLNGHWAPIYDSSKFVEEIERIPAKCHDLRIRVLAAKAVIAITHPTDYEKRLDWLLKEIPQNPNEHHSKLVQVKEIFRRFAKKDVSVIHRNLDKLIKLQKLNSSDCLITAKVFMEVLIKYLPKADHLKLRDILSEFSLVYLDEFLNRLKGILLRKGTIVGRTAVQSSFLLLKLTLAQDCESVGSFLIDCLTQSNGIVDAMLITALNIVLLLNGEEKHEIPEEVRTEIPDLEREFVTSFNEEERKLILTQIASSNELLFEQQTLSENPLVSNRAFLCLPMVKENRPIDADEVNKKLSDERSSENEKISVIRKVIGNFSALENVFQLDVESLLEFCGSEKSDFVRINISLLVAEILRISSSDRRYIRQFTLPLTRVIMQLLRDDDSDIRRITCEAILLYGRGDSSAFIDPADDVQIPCDSLALNFYLKMLMETVVPKEDSMEFLKELLKLEEADAVQENQKVYEEEGRVFDTKEANLFADRESTIRTIRCFMRLKENC